MSAGIMSYLPWFCFCLCECVYTDMPVYADVFVCCCVVYMYGQVCICIGMCTGVCAHAVQVCVHVCIYERAYVYV